MASYELAVRTTATAIGTCAELRTTSSDRIQVREIHIFVASAVAATLGLGRPAAIGVTPTSPVVHLASDPADPAGTGSVALAWATAPTAPANFFRRFSSSATIGAGVIWTFQRLIIPVSSSIVLYNIAAGPVFDAVFVCEE